MASNKFDKEQLDNALELYKVLKEMRRENGYLTEEFQKQLDAVTDFLKEYEEVSTNVEKVTKRIKEQNDFLEDTEDILGSIADKVGKNHKLYKDTEKYLNAQKAQLASIADFTQQVADEDFAQSVEKAVEAYKKYQQSVASVADRTSLTGKIQEEANIAIARARAEYEQSVAFLGDMGEEGQYVLSTLNSMADQTDKFGAAVTATTEEFNAMDSVLSNFSGIPAMSELNTLLKTNIKDTLAFKAAVFALGAALGKAAFDYFGAPIKAAMQADKERKQNEIDTIGEIAKLKTEAEFIPQQMALDRRKLESENARNIAQTIHDAAYAGARAAHEFQVSMQQGAAQFERAAKTALFGNKLGSVGYGAAQLQLAGISADKIASAMQAASSATGKMPSAKVGADMALMAERTGQSVDDIASINEAFQRLDGVSGGVALNLQEGMRAMADQAGVSLGKVMQQVAEASKDALGYQIKSAKELAKQVTYANSIGVDFGDIAKAGKSMVMNYKDSIKAEMQLSTLLGEQVDLSEVRAKFAAGDTKGAMEALKAQGLDPATMDMFQQEALSQALGGLDLNSISKIAQNTGAQVGALEGASAQKGNQEFLGKTQAAEQALNAQQAQISAQSAIFDAKLSAKIAESFAMSDAEAKYRQEQNTLAQESATLASKMEDAWKQTDAYKKMLSDTMQLDFEHNLMDTLISGAAAAMGGLAAMLAGPAIAKLFGGGGGGVTSMIPGMGGGAGGATDMLSGGTDKMQGSMGKTMTMGQKIADFAKGIGNSIKSVGKGLADFISSLGKGVGQAIRGVLQGIGQGFAALSTGLTTFGMAMAAPSPLFGLPVGLIVVGMAMGIAKALDIAAPGIQALTPLIIGLADVFGRTLVEALKVAEPIITAIFTGISKVIKTIGDVISTVITSVADSLVKIGTIDAANLMGVGLALPVLAAGLLALGAAELINGILGFVGALFGGGESIWDKLLQLAQVGPGLKMAADAVAPLADAFVKLGDVDDGDNLSDLLSNLDNAVKNVLTADAVKIIKDAGPSLLNFSKGLSSLGVVGAGTNLATLVTNLSAFVNSKIDTSLAKIAPNITTFADSMTKLQASLSGPAMQSFMMLATISKGIDLTTASIIKMTAAFTELAAINLTSLRGIPWKDMTNFSKSPGGSVVLAKNANNNFTIEKNSAKNLETISNNNAMLVKINEAMERLLLAQLTGEKQKLQLIIDGKPVTRMIERRTDNATGTAPTTK